MRAERLLNTMYFEKWTEPTNNKMAREVKFMVSCPFTPILILLPFFISVFLSGLYLVSVWKHKN